jgi:hypothetical protein
MARGRRGWVMAWSRAAAAIAESLAGMWWTGCWCRSLNSTVAGDVEIVPWDAEFTDEATVESYRA